MHVAAEVYTKKKKERIFRCGVALGLNVVVMLLILRQEGLLTTTPFLLSIYKEVSAGEYLLDT